MNFSVHAYKYTIKSIGFCIPTISLVLKQNQESRNFLSLEATLNSVLKNRPLFGAVDDYFHQAADNTPLS